MDGAFDFHTASPVANTAEKPFDVAAWINSVRVDPAAVAGPKLVISNEQSAIRKHRAQLAIAAWFEDLAADQAAQGSVAAMPVAAPAAPVTAPVAPVAAKAVAQILPQAAAALVAGTMVETAVGPMAAEDLQPGHRIMTRDHGLQPLMGISIRQTKARGMDAPMAIEAGAFGDHGRVCVSGRTAILLEGWRAEMLFGEREVLIHVADLQDDARVRLVADGAPVCFVSLMFSQPQIILANGLPLESDVSETGDADPRMMLRQDEAGVLATYGA